MPTPIDENRFTLIEGGERHVCPCVVLTLYLDLTDSSSILNFYEQSMSALGQKLQFVIAESAAKRSKISARSLSMVPTWIKKPRETKYYYIGFYEDEYGASPSSLMMFFTSNPVSAYPPARLEARRNNWRVLDQQGAAMGLSLSELRVTFPLTHRLAEPGALLDWIKGLQLIASGPLISGFCGFGLNDYRQTGDARAGTRLREFLASASLRHPGFDCENEITRALMKFNREADDLIPLVKRVNWLTFVATRTLEYLGGIEKLRARLTENPSIAVHQFPWGVIVQAGPEPQIGDLGGRDFIPVYRTVAAALRPIRLPRMKGLGNGFSDEAANEWLNSFDRDYS